MAMIIINQDMPIKKPFNITLESPSTFMQGQRCFDTSTHDVYKYNENKGWEKCE